MQSFYHNQIEHVDLQLFSRKSPDSIDTVKTPNSRDPKYSGHAVNSGQNVKSQM